jgi:hypothetical protein
MTPRSRAGSGVKAFGARLRSLAAPALVALISALYVWTAGSSGNPFVLSRTPQDYYGLLTEALLQGRLHISRPPDPGLLMLSDPYDSDANRAYRIAGVTHDLSLYRGRYYVYFGAGPVLALFAPFRILTGRYLPENLALALLAIAALLISVGILRRLAAALPRRGATTAALLVVLLGLGNWATFLLRRPRSYEVAIFAGSCFALLGAWTLARGLLPETRGRWLAFAGAAFGLAFASRPTQGLCALLMLAASVLLVRRGGRRGLRDLTLLWGPWLAVLAALLVYNRARFGDALEFGMSYQLTEWNQHRARMFSPAFLPYNAGLNLLARPMLGPEFPFFRLAPASPGVPPAGHQSVEAVAGLLWCMPATLAVLLWPAWLRRPGPLEWAGLALALQAALIAVVVLCFGVATVRYQWDFLPLLLVSAALAWLRLLASCDARPRLRRLVVAALFALVAYGAALNLAVGLTGYNDWLKHANPATYEAIEDAFLPAQQLWLAAASERYGAARFTLRLGAAPPEGASEVLLAAGGLYRHDVVCVRYAGDEHVFFRFHHRGSPPIRSPRVRLSRDAEHVVEIEMGSLLPVNARVLARLWPDAPADWNTRFALRLDGRELLRGSFDFIPSMPQQVTVGLDRVGNDQCTTPFSGRVVSVRRTLRPEAAP